MVLERKVHDLIKAWYVSFDYNAAGGPYVTSNPLPNHLGPRINALIENSIGSVKTRVSNVKTPIKSVYEALVLAKILFQKKHRLSREKNRT